MRKQIGEGATDSPLMKDTENLEKQMDLKKLIIPKSQPTQPWIFLKPHSIIERDEVPRGDCMLKNITKSGLPGYNIICIKFQTGLVSEKILIFFSCNLPSY